MFSYHHQNCDLHYTNTGTRTRTHRGCSVTLSLLKRMMSPHNTRMRARDPPPSHMSERFISRMQITLWHVRDDGPSIACRLGCGPGCADFG